MLDDGDDGADEVVVVPCLRIHKMLVPAAVLPLISSYYLATPFCSIGIALHANYWTISCVVCHRRIEKAVAFVGHGLDVQEEGDEDGSYSTLRDPLDRALHWQGSKHLDCRRINYGNTTLPEAEDVRNSHCRHVVSDYHDDPFGNLSCYCYCRCLCCLLYVYYWVPDNLWLNQHSCCTFADCSRATTDKHSQPPFCLGLVFCVIVGNWGLIWKALAEAAAQTSACDCTLVAEEARWSAAVCRPAPWALEIYWQWDPWFLLLPASSAVDLVSQCCHCWWNISRGKGLWTKKTPMMLEWLMKVSHWWLHVVFPFLYCCCWSYLIEMRQGVFAVAVAVVAFDAIHLKSKELNRHCYWYPRQY